MSNLEQYVGKVLDEKYRLERLLGQGGMGAVYLATHLGTDRYVALKLITPQFMRNQEFVERFKREARAAGRLRHPNVVDVTDFGFAEANGETVAYLVMEYLDGCTLGDVLQEDRRLPLEWVVDILEQVCSAVHEAHQQGIVHRDLKPENIWLEPNRLGGYRVKVLDFGIAKLDQPALEIEHDNHLARASSDTETLLGSPSATRAATPSPSGSTAVSSVKTGADLQQRETILFQTSSQAESAAEGEGLGGDGNGQSPQSEADTLLNVAKISPAQADERTLLFDQATRPFFHASGTTAQPASSHGAALTRVGAIMGTPIYMSPEQCGGKTSDARSDIYSLGVIAYQMLAGEPPFVGETAAVIREHIENQPVPLRECAKVPKRVAQVVMAALAKDPADRPRSAQAFAVSLRAQADGIGTLYRRAFSLYSEYFPKFLKLSFLAHVPVMCTTALLIILQLAERAQPRAAGYTFTRVSLIVGLIIGGLLQVVAFYLAGSAIAGLTAVIVTQVSAAPLRPVELRTAVAVLKRRWKPFLSTSIRVTLRIVLGSVLVIPGIIIWIRYSLYGPVVLMEGLEKKAAMKRARELASRSWRTVILVALLQVIIPSIVSAFVGRLTVTTKVSGTGVSVQNAWQQLSGLANIVILPLIAIVSALLYLKMRQLGGETLSAALAQIEEVEEKHRNWQQRMRTRVSFPSGRTERSGE